MKPVAKKLSWTPVLRGGVYCSPACGGGCTREAYETAGREAQKLLKRMRTGGWVVDVWENLGWHYCLRFTKEFSIYPTGDGHYIVCGEHTIVSNIGPMRDPNQLVKAVVAGLRERRDTAEKLISSMLSEDGQG